MSIEADFLLNLGHSPTMEELRKYFHENDLSIAKIMDIDYETLPAETVEILEEIQKIMDYENGTGDVRAPPYEDFSHDMFHSAGDSFSWKWYHTRTKTQVVSLDAM